MKRRGDRPRRGIGSAIRALRARLRRSPRSTRERVPVPLGRHWWRIIILALILATIAATAVGFWLSYAGLHAFAARSGLAGIEAWAWPSSVDLFILAGELGVTISAIRGKSDKIAWAYLGGGFVLSVFFNVSHVLPSVMPWGQYAVAATPPIAAMLALAALMRQVFRSARTSGDTVPSKVAADAESAAETALRATWLAGNPLSQNQLVDRFGLTRPKARELRSRVIPEPPAGAGSQPVPAGSSLAAANGSHGGTP